MEDQSIIALFFERDERAINESEKKYGKYCYAIAHRILDTHEDAEECVNDTWIRAWNAIPPDHPRSLSAYLGSITRNLSYDRYRYLKQKKRTGSETDLIFEELEAYLPYGDDPEEALTQKELAETVNRFLATLSERDRNILLCRYYFVQPIKEIAESHNKSPKYIQLLLIRTLKKLKQFLKKEQYL